MPCTRASLPPCVAAAGGQVTRSAAPVSRGRSGWMDGWFLGLVFARGRVEVPGGGLQRHSQPGMAVWQRHSSNAGTDTNPVGGIRANTPGRPRCVSPLPSWCRPTQPPRPPAPRSPGPKWASSRASCAGRTDGPGRPGGTQLFTVSTRDDTLPPVSGMLFRLPATACLYACGRFG